MPIHSQGLGGEEPIHDKDLQNTNNDKIINTIMLTDQPDKDLQNTNKVNRCLARYSPRATTTNQPINRALNKPGPN